MICTLWLIPLLASTSFVFRLRRAERGESVISLILRISVTINVIRHLSSISSKLSVLLQTNLYRFAPYLPTSSSVAYTICTCIAQHTIRSDPIRSATSHRRANDAVCSTNTDTTTTVHPHFFLERSHDESHPLKDPVK